MNQQINYTQEDRDRSIRTETEVKHIDTQVDVLKAETRQLVEVSRNQAFTISGILESMKDAKTFMHEVGQHSQRLNTIEQDLDRIKAVDERLQTLETKIDRVSFLGKVAWAVITTPALLALVILALQYVKMNS